MYMLHQQQSEALSSASNRSSDDSSSCSSDNDDDNHYPNEEFTDEETPDRLQVSSVDSLFNGNDGNDSNDQGGGSRRSSGALIMGKKSKPDRINLRSTSEQEADDRLDNEYGMSGSPSKLSRDTSGGSFRLQIAKIKTIFDSSDSDIRYHQLGLPPPPTSLERNTSTSSQNMVDLELAPSHRRHTVTEIPSVSWDLSKTAWSQHIQQSAFDASSRPSTTADGDWEAPTNNNDVVYEKSGWKSSMYWPRTKYEKMQLCWWLWTILIFFVGAMAMVYLILTRSSP